jgi:competence protein ComEC
VPAGHRNRWGFPARAVVERWTESGARVLVSADSGAIEFELGAQGMTPPAEWRRQRRRAWQDP